jgi:hypothetical protein
VSLVVVMHGLTNPKFKHQPGLHMGHFLFVQWPWHTNHTVTAQTNGPELAMLIADIDEVIPDGPAVFTAVSLQY